MSVRANPRVRGAVLTAVLALGVTSCASDEGTDSSSSVASTESSDSGTETGAAPLQGTCALGCSEPADCCPEGAIDCPGEYPNAWSCEAGVCVSFGCETDEQCSFVGEFPNLECHSIARVGSCFEPCTDDGDCIAIPDATCSGMADDEARYCVVAPSCTNDAECGSQGLCVEATGECHCAEDQDCLGAGLVCDT